MSDLRDALGGTRPLNSRPAFQKIGRLTESADRPQQRENDGESDPSHDVPGRDPSSDFL